MTLDEAHIRRAETAIFDAIIHSKRAKLFGVTNLKAAEMAGMSVRWSKQWYESANLVGDSLRRAVRIQFKDRYGSIWTIILFTIIWELIKEYLFETK